MRLNLYRLSSKTVYRGACRFTNYMGQGSGKFRGMKRTGRAQGRFGGASAFPQSRSAGGLVPQAFKSYRDLVEINNGGESILRAAVKVCPEISPSVTAACSSALTGSIRSGTFIFRMSGRKTTPARALAASGSTPRFPADTGPDCSGQPIPGGTSGRDISGIH